MLHFVSVGGYGWTGSSACIDILKEFEGFGDLNGEFRIIKDPYGISDLEHSLVDSWDFVRHDIAIQDFLNYCEVLSRDTSLISKVGKNFSNKLNIDLMLESELYINKLTDMTYLGDTSVHRYNAPAYKNFYMKIRSMFGYSNTNLMHLSRPDKSKFINETKNYFNKIFSGYMISKKIDTLILDQTIPPTNISGAIRYFDDIKIIIIDRDPRDIYINLSRNKTLIGADLNKIDSADNYIKWHKALRNNKQNIIENKNILRLNFEDLVYDYNASIDKIINFFSKDIIHSRKYSYFDPHSKRARSNVGLWKKYKNKAVMDKIHKKLKSYCYDFDR